MMDPLNYFSFQPMFHDWCNKGRAMRYPVCGMVHKKSKPCSGGNGFPLYLSSLFTILLLPTPYNRIKCVECVVK